jgi:hypothetical protein
MILVFNSSFHQVTLIPNPTTVKYVHRYLKEKLIIKMRQKRGRRKRHTLHAPAGLLRMPCRFANGQPKNEGKK